MSSLDAQPVSTSSSSGFGFTSDALIADPFNPDNVTWHEAVNSTSEDWGGFWVYQGGIAGSGQGILLVATGGVSDRKIIASMPTKSAVYQGFSLYVPIPVPAGSRVSVAAACAAATFQRVQIVGVKSSAFASTPPFTVLESGPYDLENDPATYGRWVKLDSGDTKNAQGAFGEISVTGANAGNNRIQGNSLAQSYAYFGALMGDNFNSSSSTFNRLMSIYIGATGSEVALIDNVHDHRNSRETQSNSVFWDPGGVSAGSRVSGRVRAARTGVNDRIVSVCLFGVR